MTNMNFEQWFKAIQEQHQHGTPHANQQAYDATLMANYTWPYMQCPPVDRAPHATRLLDVGCAYGSLSLGASLMGYAVTATDYDREYANIPALQANGVTFHEWDVYNVAPFENSNEPFDIVLFTEVLEHLDFNPILALLNIRQHMRPGGKLVLSTPRRENALNWGSNGCETDVAHWSMLPWERTAEREDRHYHLYSQTELVELLDVCGFKITGGALLWDGIGFGLSAYKTAGDTDLNAARFYSEHQRMNVWQKD